MAKLLVHESAGIREFELVDTEIHVGRELDNSLRLADPSISRHHCVIRRTASGFEVQDLQSSNGVLLNGSRIQTSPLRDGDRLTLGQIQITFSDPQSSAEATTPVVLGTAPEKPLGTIRMTVEQMAAIHGGQAPGAAGEPSPSPVQEPSPEPTMNMAKEAPPRPAIPETPAFGQFTDPGVSPREEASGFGKFIQKLKGLFGKG